MDLKALQQHQFAPRRVSYTDRDTMLYALSVGAGADPLAEQELGLVYERNLRALPTMAAVLAHPGAWIAQPQFAVNYLKLLHGEQNLLVHKTLPAQGEIEARYRVAAVADKGEGKGALVFFEKQLADSRSGELLCTVSSTLFLRADGGCGSFGEAPQPLPPTPAGKFETLGELQTEKRSALLYRLNGDRNPIHADPHSAAQAGFKQPILHGLCTYGCAGYLFLRHVCDYDTSRLAAFGARFSAPVMPGETLRLEGLRSGDGIFFQVLVPERNQVVLTQGFARIR
jgi:acyl dehydratase